MLLSRTPCLSFAGPTLGNNASYEDSFTTCQITPENHESLLDSFLNMQLASRNPFSGQIVADYFFFARFTDPPPSTCTLTFARSFAELSRNYRESIPIRPSAGGALKEKRARGALVIALAKPNFWKLGCCIWSLFLETSKSIIRQWQRQDTAGARMCFRSMVFGCHMLSRSLTFGSSAATYEGQGDCPKAQPHREMNQNQTEILWCPSPAGPRAAVGGSPLQNDYN